MLAAASLNMKIYDLNNNITGTENSSACHATKKHN